MDEIGIEQARPALGEIVDRARFTGQPTVITRQGKPAAVIVAADSLDPIISALRLAVAQAGSENHARAYGRALHALTGEGASR